MIYNTLNVDLQNLSVFLLTRKESTKKESIIEPFDINVIIDIRDPGYDANLKYPRIRISGVLPELRLKFSMQLASHLKVITDALLAKPKNDSMEPIILHYKTPIDNSTHIVKKNVINDNEFEGGFKIRTISMSLYDQDIPLVALRIVQTNAVILKTKFETNINANVTSFELLDDFQIFGSKYDYLVRSDPTKNFVQLYFFRKKPKIVQLTMELQQRFWQIFVKLTFLSTEQQSLD